MNCRAYNNMEDGSISVAKDLLFDANINRSPSSYLLNPQSERDQYINEGDTDKNMLLLKFTNTVNNESIGMLNWFAVHGTSMNATNLVRGICWSLKNAFNDEPRMLCIVWFSLIQMEHNCILEADLPL